MVVKVSLRTQRRMIEDHDTEFYIKAGETILIPERDLKANSIKALLFCGDLIIEEGEVVMNYKRAIITIKADDNKRAYIKEGDKEYVKNLEIGEIIKEEVSEDAN